MASVSGPTKVFVYQDDAGQFRWRLKAPNGEEIGKSEEGYTDHSYTRRIAQERNPEALLVDLTKLD